MVLNLAGRDGTRLASARRACLRTFDQGEQMKAVILAGGFGTRLSEETITRPKPMGRPSAGGDPLGHILKLYSHHGINDFIICCGYKGYMIKSTLPNYLLHMSECDL